ncbi:MAG: hypothetical protein ACK4GW_09605 [Pseudorhodobacter sp.]
MKYLVVIALGLLAACDVAKPVAVIGEKGEVYRGVAVASFTQGGSFTATNGKVRCGGNYALPGENTRVSFPVVCSNGQRGIGVAVRHGRGPSGSGRIRMDDGSDWTFIFGPEAQAI